jgi:hypothetical protein
MRQTASKRRAARWQRAWGCVALLGALLLTASSGCLNYPDAEERFAEELVYTHYDPAAEFGDFATFSISAEVVVFSEDDGELEREPLDEELAAQLVERVVDHMTERWYTQVESDANPDLGLTISVLNGTVTAAYVDYWGYYWGYPYYYYYYPYYYAYSYNTGTLIVDAVDLKNAPPPEPAAVAPRGGELTDKLNVVWSGLVYGVLSESTTQNLQDGLQGIDQAYEQSPYLRRE